MIADQDPSVALAGLRIEIDVLARTLAKGFRVPIDDRDSGGRLIRRLYDAGARLSQREHGPTAIQVTSCYLDWRLRSARQSSGKAWVDRGDWACEVFLDIADRISAAELK